MLRVDGSLPRPGKSASPCGGTRNNRLLMSGTGRRGGFNPLIAGFMAGVAMALVLGLLANINLDFAAPWSTTHTMTAQVSDVDGISVGSDVRIAGRLWDRSPPSRRRARTAR